ncbi:MAG: hypothetical protein GC134_09435 [Proteobacteria bacterium]|nr:hypothetical protein [Pseudomonadota bacterium]
MSKTCNKILVFTAIVLVVAGGKPVGDLVPEMASAIAFGALVLSMGALIVSACTFYAGRLVSTLRRACIAIILTAVSGAAYVASAAAFGSTESLAAVSGVIFFLGAAVLTVFGLWMANTVMNHQHV